MGREEKGGRSEGGGKVRRWERGRDVGRKKEVRGEG